MTFRTGISLVVTSGMIMTACSSFQTGGKRGVASTEASEAFKGKEARALSADEIAKFSSTGRMKVSNGKVITDNFTSYNSKVKIAQSAEHELSMVYFIYADDNSSSAFTQAVIAAAKKGVKVNILVDFITNYERIDLFRFMEEEGKKDGISNLKVRFYGLPTKPVLKTALYQTTPCTHPSEDKTESTACQTEKAAKLKYLEEGDVKVETTWFSRMWLTGLYGKNETLSKIATGVGGQFDPAALKAAGGDQKIPADKAKGFGKLVIDAKVKNSFGSKIKLAMALSSYGSTLGPVMNTILGVVPFEAVGGEGAQDMDHLTDYTHHKLIIADGKRFQLGGRNIEDSYHTDNYSKKYTFIDTDFYGESDDAARMQASYNTLIGFKAMVGDIADADRLAPNEYDANIEAFGAAFQGCMEARAGDLEYCTNQKIRTLPNYKNVAARIAAKRTEMGQKAGEFAKYDGKKFQFNWNPNGNTLTDANAEVYYLENTSFSRNNPSQRLFGSQIGREHENGKNIHAAWVRGIENTCAVSARTGEKKRIVLHSAYFFMSSNIFNAIGNTINGKWDCRNVSIDLITNSFVTTDLNVINVFARHQLRSLLKYDWARENEKKNAASDAVKKATIAYYEYLPHFPDGTTPKSLHTKLSVLGDDMIIGSANADVRSYSMDTNNAVMVRNAPSLIKDYLAFVDKLKDPNSGIFYKMWQAGVVLPDATGMRPQPPISYAGITDEQMDFHNKVIIKQLQLRWDKDGKHLTPAKQAEINVAITRLGKQIEKASDAILKGTDAEGNSLAPIDLDKIANDFDNDWKTL